MFADLPGASFTSLAFYSEWLAPLMPFGNLEQRFVMAVTIYAPMESGCSTAGSVLIHGFKSTDGIHPDSAMTISYVLWPCF